MENNLTPVLEEKLRETGQIKFDISDSALACVLFIAFNILFDFVLGLFNISIVEGTFLFFVLQAAVEGMFALGAYTVAFLKKKDLVKCTGLNKKVNGKIVLFAFLVSVVSLLGFGNITNVFIEILEKLGYKSILGNISISNFGEYIGYVIAVSLVAAFSEELLFRGVILSGFKKYGVKIAVGVSAFIFMIMHGNAEQTVHQFIIGLVIGLIFYKTGNLWIGFLIHAFNNFIPLTEVFILTSAGVMETATEAAAVTWGGIIVDLLFAVIYAAVGVYILKYLFKKIIEESEKLNGKTEQATNLASITIDGDESKVEMAIDGEPVEVNGESETAQEPDKKLSIFTILMFTLSGLYLVVNWLFYTLYGFGIIKL